MPLEIKIPSLGESVAEVEIGSWLIEEGDQVDKDENLVVIESDKATVELPAPATGRLAKILKQKGARLPIGEIIALLEPASQPSPDPTKENTTAPPPKPITPAARRLLAESGLTPENIPASGPGGRLLKEDVLRALKTTSARAAAPQPPPPPTQAAPSAAPLPGNRSEEVVPMNLLRRTIAQRLVEAKQNAALLTTFNEIDMTAVLDLRRQYQEAFQARFNVKLGFMSFFVKATIDALSRIPQLNAEIRGHDIVYRNYYDIGVAIGAERGLVVPVLRNAERLSFAEIEQAIHELASRAQQNRLKPDELRGGTFTISNGGVYGSLLSTPIVNPPQSGVLGLHAIQDRPVALNKNVVIRPMMYIALTYDHRIVDGREAVTFLKRIKEAIEDPARMLIEV